MIKLIRIQPFDISFILVFAKTPQEFAKLIKNNKKVSKFLKEENVDLILSEGNYGCVLSNPLTDRPLCLYVQKRKIDYYFANTLRHETHHVVFKLAKHCKFEEEAEFQAYLYTYLYDLFYAEFTKK